MPELIEQMYCSQQIIVPPKFPYILKKYCKAAIKTQPYDLLRWSYEYFSALAQHRPPPVKLRLEYPVYSTEGGLTRGCLKVLANQLGVSPVVPVRAVITAWRGFCLDPAELNRILCLCEVYLRKNEVPFLHFIAVAAGLLTKTLTHTMILLCESLTKEPDGGSAAIPAQDFLTMYKFLATMDASKDVKYFNGYREGTQPIRQEESVVEEQKSLETLEEESAGERSVDTPQEGTGSLTQVYRVNVFTNERVSRTTKLCENIKMPYDKKVERSPSMERAREIVRENFMRERIGHRATADAEMDRKLKGLSNERYTEYEGTDDSKRDEGKEEEKEENLEIVITDEDGTEVKYADHVAEVANVEEVGEELTDVLGAEEVTPEEESKKLTEKERIKEYVKNCYKERDARREDIEETFNEIGAIVDRFKSANYDLGMVAGRQMSTTSGEFIVDHIEKEIMDDVNERIAILPDPEKKKKKAKPEDITMIRDILEKFLDENMDVLVQDVEEIEEEQAPMPEVTVVYAVPGIGGPVDPDTVREFEEYALEVSQAQADLFMPRNIRHFMCPPLHKYEEPTDDEQKKEEVAMAGVITD